MYHYLHVFEIVESEEREKVPTCGIRVVKEEGDESKEIRYIPDVFTDLALGERFAALCTREQLDPIHLMDTIEDFMP